MKQAKKNVDENVIDYIVSWTQVYKVYELW